jgi:hypothetical protein
MMILDRSGRLVVIARTIMRDLTHANVDHAKRQCVVGAVHTQTIAGNNNRFNEDTFGTAIEGA